MKFLVGTTVELEVEAGSKAEAEHIVYQMLKNMNFDVGDMNSFEVSDGDEDVE